jgi:thioredoxin-like negative regulator of GroEL
MVPVLEEVSEKLREKILVVKIDTEKYVDIANKYRIEALPTFIIFKDGKPCDRFVSFKIVTSFLLTIKIVLQLKSSFHLITLWEFSHIVQSCL